MVLRHFKLREQPFGVTPDPRYLYASSTHREALASLLYGIESGLGFVALTANPGMGKTTLLFEALRRMNETTRTVFLFQTIATPIDLMRALLIDLGVKETQGTMVELQTQLNEVLVSQSATGKRLVVAIDEAQNLDLSVLEAVRMLSNFETARQKLMQIILAGQLQLAEKLAQPELLQLRQRVSIFAHLKPLSALETEAYIQHRLRVAGYDSSEPLFTSSAVKLIARESEGIPRNINNICFNALSLGCAMKRSKIDSDVIQEVLNDLDFESIGISEKTSKETAREARQTGYPSTTSRPAPSRLRIAAIAALVCAIVGVFTWLILLDYRAISGEGSVQANAAAVQPAPAAPAANPPLRAPGPASSSTSAPAGASIPAPTSGTRSVRVRDGQSLYGICLESFGQCRPEILKQIIKLNPSISDPDHIVSGQQVSLPVYVSNPVEQK